MRSTSTGIVGRRVRMAVVALATLAASVGAIGSPPAGAAVDTSWKPAAGSLPATTTYAYVTSASGDYIGGGRTYTYTPAETDLTIQADGGRVTVWIEGEQGWSAEFVPPEGVTSLVPGSVYTGLERYPFHDDAVGGLSFTGEGRGCNESVGWYAVDEATYAAGVLQTLVLRFEQRCERATAAPLRGQIRYDIATPTGVPPTPTLPVPPLWVPAGGTTPATGNYLYLSSTAGDWVGKGRSYLFTDDELAIDGGGASIGFRIDTDQDWFFGNFAASNRADQITGGHYATLQRYPFHNAVRGGFSISGNGAGCNTLKAWVVVDEVDQTRGELNDLTLRFQQNCEGGSSALRGKIRYELPPTPGTPGAPTAVSATAEPRGAEVRWTAPTSTGTSATTGYEVIVYEQGTVRQQPIAVGPDARSLTVEDLPIGVPHTFKVRAVNALGPGGRSTASTPVAPLDPTPHVTALAPSSGVRTGGTPIQLTGTGLADATAVRIGGTSVPFTQVSGTRIDLTSPALSAGAHAVVVTTAEGTSPSVPAATWTAKALPPGAPSAVTGTPRQAAIDVTWTPPASTGDGPVTAYLLSATKLGALSAQATSSAAGTATGGALTGLTPGATYLVKVVASSAAGAGPAASSAAVTVPAPDIDPFADATALVRQQYLDFVGRSATPGEASAGAAPILAGTTTPEAYVAAMRTRAEWAGTRAPVVRLYSAYFDRLPDAAGLSYWAAKVRAGTSLARVSATFAASREFVRAYGPLGNRDFVLRIYANVLHRTPDAGGVSYWTKKLDGGTSRGIVMNNFSESSENVRVTGPAVDVILLHAGMLRTVPAGQVLADEVAALEGGGTLAELARRILDSPAYTARFT